ncbi:MAG: flavin reductase family protein [Clostridia bacterium]|nr:flavin reductase family protein [Clostridia bacterium]MBR5881819.1 flavin reductase family protein [Clostridia bacterium]
MAKIKWRGGALLAPAPPALVTCGDMEKSNALAVAWTGIINTVPPKTYISVRPGRYSYSMIKESGEFVINLTSADMIKALDGCGMLTGAKVDKFKKFGLEKQEASEVGCPLVAQSPLSLECRVTDIIELGSHHMFLADVVAVDVEEDLIDQHGKLRLDKANLAAFAHGEYFALGKKIGDFGFSVRKKKKTPPKKK